MISSVVNKKRWCMVIMFIKIFYSPEQIVCKDRLATWPKGTDLDGHSFCCFEAASMDSFISGLNRS